MKNKRKFGFTLVELLVVIAILAILSTVTISSYRSFVDKARRSNMESEMAQVKNLYVAYCSTELSGDDLKENIDSFIDYCYENGVKENTVNYFINENFQEPVEKKQAKRAINLDEAEEVEEKISEIIFLLKNSDGNNYFGSFSTKAKGAKLDEPIKTKSEVIAKGIEEITKKTIGEISEENTKESWEYVVDSSKDFNKTKRVRINFSNELGEPLKSIESRSGKYLNRVVADKLIPNSIYYVLDEPRAGFVKGDDNLYYFNYDKIVWVDDSLKQFDFSKALSLDSPDVLNLKQSKDSSIKLPEFSNNLKIKRNTETYIKTYEKKFADELDNDLTKFFIYYFENPQLALNFSQGIYDSKVIKTKYKVSGGGCGSEYVKTDEVIGTPEVVTQQMNEEVDLLKSITVNNLSIPADKTLNLKINNNTDLLVVFNNKSTVENRDVAIKTNLPNITLTVNGKLDVKGFLNVGANVTSIANSISGSTIIPVGSLLENYEYNMVYLNKKANLQISKDGLVKAYGKITGAGSLDVYGKLYELGEIIDHRGGGNILYCGTNDVFPFFFYNLVHVDATTRFYRDCNYEVLFPLRESSGSNRDSTAKFICDKNSNNGLFVIDSGYIQKDISNGKMNFSINGAVHDNKMALEISGTELPLDVFDFPLCNFNVVLKPKSTLDIKYTNFKVLPNSHILIEEGATFSTEGRLTAFSKFDYYNKIINANDPSKTVLDAYSTFYAKEFASTKATEGYIQIDGTLNIGNKSIVAGKFIVNGILNNSSVNTIYDVKEGAGNGLGGQFNPTGVGETISLELEFNEETKNIYTMIPYDKNVVKAEVVSDVLSIDELGNIVVDEAKRTLDDQIIEIKLIKTVIVDVTDSQGVVTQQEEKTLMAVINYVVKGNK